LLSFGKSLLMKTLFIFISGFLFISCAKGNDHIYTGSTPGGPVVKAFLGIPLPDSIDFIRWKLVINDNSYRLECNYGISKPNTRGFMNGGKKLEFTGALKTEKKYYELLHDNRSLKLARLNEDLLHPVHANNELLVGSGGWSYTLTHTVVSGTDDINFTTQQGTFKDSMALVGRTPCGIPGLLEAGTYCYKLKWSVVLYANAKQDEPGTYKLRGTAFEKTGARTGYWKIIHGKNGRIIYKLVDAGANGSLYLLKAGEHIFLFTDADGKLLTGDEDFSYTLNRKY
jgi:hypothetical protein